MKNLVITGILAVFPFQPILSQVSINTDNSTPDPSAGLEVKFDNKGFLPPRMTTSQMLAISSPAEGLMIYNTEVHAMVFFNGTGWSSLGNKRFLGESYGGGIIYFLDGTNEHGLIAAPNDCSQMGDWGCFGNSIPGTMTDIGSGQANTTIIVNGCLSTSTAAWLCSNFELNGYNDWFLPSRDELIEMYNQRALLGSFFPNYYWSSSEYSAGDSWSLEFENGTYYGRAKYDYCYIRPIRSF